MTLKRISDRLLAQDIIVHDLLTRKNEYLFAIKKIKFHNDNIKESIFYNMLNIKLHSDYVLLEKFVNRFVSHPPFDKYSLAVSLQELVNVMVDKFDILFYDYLRKTYGSAKATRLYNLVMNGKIDGCDTHTGFGHKRYVRVSNLHSKISGELLNSDILTCNNQRLLYFLTEVQNVIRNLIMNLEEEFKRLNGEFARIVNEDN